MTHIRDLSTQLYEQFQELNRDGRGFILIAISMGWFLSIGVRNVFPVLIPYMRSSFSMSLTASGFLFTLLWSFYGLGQFPGGILVDRIGGRNILVISMVCSLLTLFILIVAVNVWLLFVATVLFGLATALYGPTRFTVLNDIFDENDGLAIGITLAAGSIGNVVLPSIAGLLAVYLVWQAGFGFVVPLFIISIILIWYKVPDETNSTAESGLGSKSVANKLYTVVNAVLRPKILIITSILLMNTFILQGFTGFFPTYLVEVKGISPTVATAFYGVFFTVGIVVQLLSGIGNDNFSPSLTIAAFLGCIVIGMVSLPFLHSEYSLVAITFLLSGLMGTSPTATSQLVYLLPEESKGSGLALVRTLYMLLASTGSVVIGFFADIGFFDESFVMLSMVALVAFSLAIFYFVRYERDPVR